jgi:hypothetical protein
MSEETKPGDAGGDRRGRLLAHRALDRGVVVVGFPSAGAAQVYEVVRGDEGELELAHRGTVPVTPSPLGPDSAPDAAGAAGAPLEAARALMARARRQTRFDPYAILEALERERVTYVLIGGLARVIEGSDELTRGVDLTPSTRPENLRRLDVALRSLDARPRDGRALSLDELSTTPLLALESEQRRDQRRARPGPHPRLRRPSPRSQT